MYLKKRIFVFVLLINPHRRFKKKIAHPFACVPVGRVQRSVVAARDRIIVVHSVVHVLWLVAGVRALLLLVVLLLRLFGLADIVDAGFGTGQRARFVRAERQIVAIWRRRDEFAASI